MGTSIDFQNAKSTIQNAAVEDKEHDISFGKDNNGNIIKSTMSTGDENSGTAPSISNKFADIHNHRDNNPPSPGDIYSFIDGIINQPNFTTRYVIASGGDVYALVLTDKQAAINFNDNNPRIRLKDTDGKLLPPDFPDPLFSDLDITRIKLEYSGASHLDADANAFAWILEKYNTGIILLKENSNEAFKKLGTKEVNQNGTIIYTINNCQ